MAHKIVEILGVLGFILAVIDLIINIRRKTNDRQYFK